MLPPEFHTRGLDRLVLNHSRLPSGDQSCSLRGLDWASAILAREVLDLRYRRHSGRVGRFIASKPTPCLLTNPAALALRVNVRLCAETGNRQPARPSTPRRPIHRILALAQSSASSSSSQVTHIQTSTAADEEVQKHKFTLRKLISTIAITCRFTL
ncbi:hypothetical protein J6590_068624 [Homalodisca vitripennis]|nr:hypothetical protein J6590_068624 [Homalodisca vitripennis]